MKRGLRRCSFTLVFLCCFFLQGGFTAFAKTDKPQATAYRKDTLLVKFKHGVSAAESSSSHEKRGSRKVREFSGLRIHQVGLKTGVTVEEAIREYAQDSTVEFAEPDYAISVSVIPNDPRFGESWGLNNTGQAGGTLSADIRAPDAWNITTGSRTIVIAVNDTGIDYTHQDLAQNVWENSAEHNGLPGIDDDGNGYVDDVYGIDTFNHTGDPFDDNDHGTHVSGIVGATGNNGIGVAGINWNVQILSCKFFDSSGVGYTSGAIECLEYERALKNNGVNIVATNNSWGGTEYSQALCDAIKAQQDILFVAAAGNYGQDNDLYGWYPANYELPNIISVAASDRKGKRPSLSGYGRRSVHVAAPGVNILSTLPGNRYGSLSGTSMATPHVTGVAALIVAQDSTRDWRETRNLILSGGEDVASWAGVTITGKRLNANGSLTCADKPVFSALRYPSAISVDVPVTLSALSINCGLAVGPVTVTTSGGDIVTLSDGGIAPDLAAGDGIYAGQWTPTKAGERLTFLSPSGTETISTPELSIEFEVLASALGVSWSHSLKASGGLPPYVWSLASGGLPPGLTLNTATGEISGTAVTPGAFNCTVRVADALNQEVERPLTIRTTDESLHEEWKSFYDSGTGDLANGMAVDDRGNVYATGASYLGSSTDYHILTIKYDPAGNVTWAKTYSGGDYDSAGSVVVDKSGNVYVAGSSFWPSHWTVIKYDPAGNVVWTKTDLGWYGYASGIAADANGNIYVLGRYNEDYRIIEYDPSGKVMWDWMYDSGKNDFPGRLALDDIGNMYVGGFTYEDFSYHNGCIVKFGPTGQVAWTKTFEEDNDNYLTGTATDKGGNVYAVKKSYIATHWETLTTKLDPFGNTVWATTYRGYEGDAMAVDESGNVYVTGSVWNGSAYAILTIKYDASGNAVWTQSYDRGCRDLGQAVTVDRIGNIYVSGDSCNGSNNDYLTIKYHDPTWVHPPNTSPVASDQTLSIPEDISKAITLSATDAEGDLLTYAVVTGPAHGTLSGIAPDVTYHPAPDFIGTDSFTFQAHDGWLDSNIASVIITVADTTPPTGSILINGGNAYTITPSVILNLSASDGEGGGLASMRFRNSATDPYGAWEPFQITKEWTLTSGDGTKKVYVQFKDAAGNISDANPAAAGAQGYMAAIVYDPTAPTGSILINNNAASTDNAAVTLNLTAADGGGSGLASMRFRSTTTELYSDWEPYKSTKAWTLTGGFGTRKIYAQFMDKAGNISDANATTAGAQAYMDAIEYKDREGIAPTGSIQINNGAEAINTTAATLNLAATDTGGSGLASMRFRNNTTDPYSAWEPFQSTKAWTLTSGAGTKKVYVQFADVAGNLSDANATAAGAQGYMDSIVLTP